MKIFLTILFIASIVYLIIHHFKYSALKKSYEEYWNDTKRAYEWKLKADEMEKKLTAKTSDIVRLTYERDDAEKRLNTMSKVEGISEKYDMKLMLDECHQLLKKFAQESMNVYSSISPSYVLKTLSEQVFAYHRRHEIETLIPQEPIPEAPEINKKKTSRFIGENEAIANLRRCNNLYKLSLFKTDTRQEVQKEYSIRLAQILADLKSNNYSSEITNKEFRHLFRSIASQRLLNVLTSFDNEKPIMSITDKEMKNRRNCGAVLIEEFKMLKSTLDIKR